MRFMEYYKADTAKEAYKIGMTLCRMTDLETMAEIYQRTEKDETDIKNYKPDPEYLIAKGRDGKMAVRRLKEPVSRICVTREPDIPLQKWT